MVELYNCVIVVEVMGCYVGWIVVYSGIVGGVDVIFVFECLFDIDEVCECIKCCYV